MIRVCRNPRTHGGFAASGAVALSRTTSGARDCTSQQRHAERAVNLSVGARQMLCDIAAPSSIIGSTCFEQLRLELATSQTPAAREGRSARPVGACHA